MKNILEIDFINAQHLLPKVVQDLLNEFQQEENTYEVCAELENALKDQGYVISWGLDAEPYDLKKIDNKSS